MRKINEAGIDFIKRWEGRNGKAVLEAYLDTGGVPTIGFGHIKDVKIGDEITEEEAEQFLKDELTEYEECVEKHVKVELNDQQFAALVSFVYNVGKSAFENSTLLRLLNKGEYRAAANQFPRWCRDNGKIIRGLQNRRKAEKELFNS